VADEAHATNKAVAPKEAIEFNAEAKVIESDEANDADVTKFDEADEAIRINAADEAIATNEAEID
jgi:hypothetical protein